MPKIFPFRALRPKTEVASDIAALPYDVYSREEAKKVVEEHPLSFLRVDRAETTLPDCVGMYEPVVYKRAKDNLKILKDVGYLVKEDKPCLYLYELTLGGESQTGVVATCLVDEVVNKTIKENELTRQEKLTDRINHVDTLEAQTGPIFLIYKNNKDLSETIESLKTNYPLYNFVSEDGVIQKAWKIEDESVIEDLMSQFSNIENFYIADGHHRCASAVEVALRRRESEGPGEYDRFLSVIFPDNELKILDYNRVVSDLNGLSKEEFLEKLSDKFEIETSEVPVKPEKKGQYGMFLDGKWYKLTLKEEIPEDSLEGLDVSILSNTVLTPILGIGDPRTDKRIDFVGGIKGLKELEKRVNSDMKVAFSLYPTKLSEVMEIADEEKMMPPKSTWFEPKLRSGLFIHEFT